LLKLAIPVLHVSNIAAAEEFYCRRLGFTREFAHRGDPSRPDPCYVSVNRDSIRLHLSSFSGGSVAGGVVNLVVEDVDALHTEFLSRGVAIAVEPVDQTWGTREMYVQDADGNCLRFQQLHSWRIVELNDR
jgi:uncharacterized glyoxalase superfamily protein PhnB